MRGAGGGVGRGFMVWVVLNLLFLNIEWQELNASCTVLRLKFETCTGAGIETISSRAQEEF